MNREASEHLSIEPKSPQRSKKFTAEAKSIRNREVKSRNGRRLGGHLDKDRLCIMN